MDIDNDVIIEEFDSSPREEFSPAGFIKDAVEKGQARDAAREEREREQPVDETPRPAADSKSKQEPEAAKAPSTDAATQDDPEPGEAPTSDPGPKTDEATQRTYAGGKFQSVDALETGYTESSREAQRLRHQARELEQRLSEAAVRLEQLESQQRPIAFEELSERQQRHYELRSLDEGKSPELLYELDLEHARNARAGESQILAQMHAQAAVKIVEHLATIPEDFRANITEALQSHPEFSAALDKMHPEAALEFGRHYLDQAHELQKLKAENARLQAEMKVREESAHRDGIAEARANINRKRRSGTEAGRDMTTDTDFSKATALKPKSMLEGLIADKGQAGEYTWVD